FPLRDISGNEHHATTSGNPIRVSGKVGQDGLSFDASSHLVVDNVALGASSSFSISAWVKPDSHGQWAPIVYSNSSGSAGFRFYTTTNRIQFTLRDETSSFRNVISDTSLVNGVWSLVTAVYDVAGTNMHLYINGQLDKTTLGVGNLDANFYNGASMFSQIGGGDNNPGRFFQGSLDDIRIYNIALTQSNVNRLYARGTLVGHWQLEQNIGDISKDVSDYNNVANVLGDPIWIQGAIGNKALHFDAGDAMNMENIPLHADASFTISVWVNPATRNALAPILYSGAGEESGFRFHSSGGKIQFTLRNSNPDINLSLKTVVSSAELLTDEWSLVTGVYDINNDSMFLYINGVEVGTTSSIGTLDASYYDGSVTFSQVGGGHTDPDKTFAGSLDDIRIVNRALSAAEVFVLSNQIDRLTDTDNDTVTDIYDNCVSMVNADQLNTDGDANGNECDTDDDNDGLLDDLELLIGTNSLLIDTDADGLSDFDEVNFDGDPAQYIPGQDLDPLLKDTDGDSFNDGAEVSAGSDPLNSSSVPAISAPVLNLLGFLGILIGVLAIGAKRIRAN
ncbi:MAG: LamG-like jellyroll fold domain-containing protein, partial [Thiotrichaceae bacterium]